MLQIEDLPCMTSLSPGNDVMDLKSTQLMNQVNNKHMIIFNIFVIHDKYNIYIL